MSTEGTEQKMSSHESDLKVTEACGSAPMKPHHPKDRAGHPGDGGIDEETLKSKWLLTLEIKEEEWEERVSGMTFTRETHGEGKESGAPTGTRETSEGNQKPRRTWWTKPGD